LRQILVDTRLDITAFYQNGTERMRIDSSGNVLIGNTAQIGTEKLNVNILSGGTAYSTTSMQSSALAWLNNAENDLTKASTLVLRQFNAASAISGLYTGTQNAALTFGTSNSGSSGNVVERMRINSSGTVSIGTTCSFGTLNLSGYSVHGLDTNPNEQRIIDVRSDTRIALCSETAYNASPTSSILFSTKYRSDASYQRAVAAIVAGKSDAADFYNTGYLAFLTSPQGPPTERMRIDASGNLLIGTTSAPTTIGGSGFIANPNNRYVLSLGSDTSAPRNVAEFRTSLGLAGRIEVQSLTTDYVTSSDVRLKDNIVDAPAGNIDSIKVRSFDWKADGSHQTYGMVAQELVDVAPEAVSQGETEDDMWGVDYSKLVPMMIKEIQDLKAEVAALKGA
jgi:hypothetical protein